MFVKDSRDEAFARIKSGKKQALFSKDLMWGKKERAKRALFERKKMEEKTLMEAKRLMKERKSSPVYNATDAEKSSSQRA